MRCSSEARLVDGSCRAPEILPCESGLRDGVTGECVPDERCRRGTVRRGDACVDPTACVHGTVRDGDECVPDGSVLCEGGAVFDPETGRCGADPDICADGTVLVEGRCVPYDETLEADVTEGPENNDPTRGGAAVALALPAAGETTTARGCLVPADTDGDGALDADRDGFHVSVTEPTVIRVRVDGVGGASGGFEIVPEDAQLLADGWRRLGVSLVGDEVERDVFLPKAGWYALLVGDSRSLVRDAAVGGPGHCYFATVGVRPTPSPTRFDRETAGPLTGVRVLETTTERAGEVFVTARSSSRAASVSVVLMDGDRYAGSIARPGPDALSFPLAWRPAGETLTFVVEPEVRTSVTEPRFELQLESVLELESGRSYYTATEVQRGLVLRVSRSSRGVDHITWTAGDPAARVFVEAVRADSSPYGAYQPCSRGACTGSHRHAVYSGGASTYYLRVRSATPTSLDFESEAAPVAVEPLGRRESVTVEPGARLYLLPAVGDVDWLQLAPASAGSYGGSVGVYDRLQDGELGAPTWGQLGSDERWSRLDVVARPVGQTLLVVQNDSTGSVGYWRNLQRGVVVSHPPALDAGRLAPGAPYVYEQPWPSSASRWREEEARFFVRAAPGHAIRVRASHPDAETLVTSWLTMPHLASLTYSVSVGGWAVGPAPALETAISAAPDGWRLLSVRATFDLPWGAPAPDMRVEIEAVPVADDYTVTEVPLATSSVCPSRGGAGAVALDGSTGASHHLTGVPEIRLFGLPTGPLFASRHGTLSRAAPTVPEHLTRPSTDGIAAVSVVGEWLTDASALCVLDDAAALTLEWDGFAESGARVHAQVRVDRATDTVELSYFPDHALRLPPARAVGLANRTKELLALHEEPIPLGRTLRFTPAVRP